MGSVWKRLNRINKRASKYKFTASYQELYLEAGPSWQPNSLSVVWTRRGRRVVADPMTWEPTMKSPYIGMCVWPVPDNKEITVTLFRDQRQEEYDNKDWFFVLEDVRDGKRKPVAQGRLNLKDFARQIPHQENLRVKLRPLNKKVSACYLVLTLTSEFIKEGKATDDDMRSVASLVSNSTLHNDIADLDTLIEDQELEDDVTVSIPVSEFEALTASIQSMNQKLDHLTPSLVPVRTLLQPGPNRTLQSRPAKEQLSPSVDSGRPVAIHVVTTEAALVTRLETTSRSSFFSNNNTLPIVPPRKVSSNTKASDAEAETSKLANTPYSTKNSKVLDTHYNKLTPSPKLEAVEFREDISSTAGREISKTSLSYAQTISTSLPPPTGPPPPEAEAVETRSVTTKHRVEKIQKTKSQELRDFTQEFVRSTVVDFDPMSLEDHTPTLVRSSMRRTEVKTERRGINTEEKTTMAEGKATMAEVKTTISEVRAATAEVKTTMTEEIRTEKHEIVPSDSFLSSLDRETMSSDENSSETNLTSPPAQNRILLPDHGRNMVGSETSPVPLSSLVSPAKPDSRVSQPKSGTSQNMDTSRVQGAQGASSDLLDWSKSILSKYPNVKVTNFTTSWRNGLAFCALLHSFYPDLVDFPSLNAHDIKHNCKVAFEAGERLGIPRVLEPENMAIKKIPDKLAVITYLHQLRSCLGTAETAVLYESSKLENSARTSAIRKSYSEGNIKLFSRTISIDSERTNKELPTVLEESSNGEAPSKPVSKYRQKAKDLMEAARRDSSDKTASISPERENILPTSNVIRRQKSLTPKTRRDNRLSYIDNEMKVLDAEQQEIDRQAAILDKRLRETGEEDQLVYDTLLQQWFTLVNKKNTLLRRQMQLNILEKEDDLEKKFMLLQDELRMYSDMDEKRKTDEDCEREELLLQELVLVVNQRNELVLQRDDEERMIENDELIEHDVTIPDERLVHNRGGRDDCKMQ